ncbi:MAG: thermopsin family protease [Thermoplasmata archaeon]|nr:thermopsin family protease [Thermoplasmata archaeon]MCI4360010.1 thermopsin family protease [Thermoplasmata archaeon]
MPAHPHLRTAPPHLSIEARSAEGGVGRAPYWLGGPRLPVASPAGAHGGTGAPASVNPYASYGSEPAPMGLGDVGVGSSGSVYSYSTSAFRATAHIASFSSFSSQNGNWSSLQLNVVVVMSRGSALAEYWIQDVPIFNSSSHLIAIENNVWNFSGSGAGLPANSVLGNGTVYTSGAYQYYADGVSSGYPGAGVTLSLPVNISTEVVASNLSGQTHVGFQYNDGYGWVTYDNVTFPWTTGWRFHGFEVTGTSYNPFGLFDDAEWVVAGPGGGSSVADLRSNITMSLDEFNGHNFEAVPSAYSFGSDTGESASNVLPSLLASGSPGAPSDRLGAGSGTLGLMYGAVNVSTLNVSAPVLDGTLLINGVPTAYLGNQANLTVMPGSYHLAVENQSTIVASKNVSVSAKEYLPVGFAKFSVNPGRAQSAGSVGANGTGFVAGSTVSVNWPGNSTAQCQKKAAPNGSFSCSFSVPLVPAGPYNISASDNASGSDVAWTTVVVTTNMTVKEAASAVLRDLGGSIQFWANATGGFPPYSNYQWNFGDGPPSLTTGGTTNHTYARSGTFTVVATVRDRIEDTISANVTVRILADPLVTQPIANRTSADLGQAVSFVVSASAGQSPYQYVWNGLPAGCSPSGNQANCPDLTGAGNYSIHVVLTDSAGVRSTGSTLAFSVFDDPSIASFTDRRPYLDAGQNLSLVVSAVRGSGSFTYAWLGLPAGCSSITNQVDCSVSAPGVWAVQVRATDSNGVPATSPALPLTVAVDPSVVVASSASGSLDLGQDAGLAALAHGGSGAFQYRWTGLPPGCQSASLSILPCIPTQTGTFSVGVTVVDQSGALAQSSLLVTVFTAPSVGWVYVSTTTSDVGHTVTLEVASSGGNGPYSYLWGNLPTGCPSQNASVIGCDPTGPGSFTLSVQSEDANHVTSTAPGLSLIVEPSPTIASLTASAHQVVSGYPLGLAAQPSGGTGPFTYQWYELPGGCAPRNVSEIHCHPMAAGNYAITVVATDSLGESANATIRVTVIAAVLGLSPTEGYAVILAGLGGLALLGCLAVRWVRRSRSVRKTSEPGDPSPSP